MVTTKLSEVVGKGFNYFTSPPPTSEESSSSSQPVVQRADSFLSPNKSRIGSSRNSNIVRRHSSSADTNSEISSVPSHNQPRQSSIKRAAESTCSGLSTAFSYLSLHGKSDGKDDATQSIPREKAYSGDSSSGDSSSTNPSSLSGGKKRRSSLVDLNTSTLLSPTLLKLIHNPYISVRGPGRQDQAKPQQSMEAVRKLLQIVPLDEESYLLHEDNELRARPRIIGSSDDRYYINDEGDDGGIIDTDSPGDSTNESPCPLSSSSPAIKSRKKDSHQSFLPSSIETDLQGHDQHGLVGQRKEQAFTSDNLPANNTSNVPSHVSSPEETASQLAEGILRAYRDIALDEAVELHASLQYWTNRWERPLLSWFEAGPIIWFSKDRYNHQLIGRKVSQIQAVLARRLSAIGELQQHLLKSGLQRGVAQWNFLGEGGEWAAVAGSDGRMDEDYARFARNGNNTSGGRNNESSLSNAYTLRRKTSDQLLHHPTPIEQNMPSSAPRSRTSKLPQRSRYHNQLYYTNLCVKMKDGGQILKDDPALAEWSVDAMALIRSHLHRAANGMLHLPCSEHWIGKDNPDSIDDVRHTNSIPPAQGLTVEVSESGETIPDNNDMLEAENDSLPVWASTESENNGEENNLLENEQQVIISNLPLMVKEVSDLLDVMEDIMNIQRSRRLEKLRPPSWWRQNWFLSAVCAPSLVCVLYKYTINGRGLIIWKRMSRIVTEFVSSHVIHPCYAIYHELTKGTEYFSDRSARDTAVTTLKKMIRSWLDETHPEMPVRERSRLSEAMDISLIEQTKETNMKTIYELNSVIRMSFIEAQFIKKEMMNALVALDEMQASTNFNMNLAAITPFIILTWTAKRISSFILYTTFKWGKSRKETYGSFRHILTEIERLLIMRNNPPTSNDNNNNNNTIMSTTGRGLIQQQRRRQQQQQSVSITVLDSDDLGMLMLHLHELRTILWTEKRRFTIDMLRSIVEDLAELSGERGAVSVRQQLLIIQRMSRIYPFLQPYNYIE